MNTAASFLRQYVFLVIVFDDRPSRNDPYEHSPVIRDWYEVGIHGLRNKFLNRLCNKHRSVLVFVEVYVRELELL